MVTDSWLAHQHPLDHIVVIETLLFLPTFFHSSSSLTTLHFPVFVNSLHSLHLLSSVFLALTLFTHCVRFPIIGMSSGHRDSMKQRRKQKSPFSFAWRCRGNSPPPPHTHTAHTQHIQSDTRARASVTNPLTIAHTTARAAIS
jgi:hypothetical protein